MNFDVAIVQAAIVLGAIGLGGGLYETALVDRVWPKLPQLIQPQRGGINRKLFWMPAHTAYELALIAAVAMNWQHTATRSWLLAALAIHAVSRVWSFAYFIRAAIGFERAGDLTPSQTEAAWAWTRHSRWRIMIEACSVLALVFALAR